jgi:hypothetical protein
MPPYPGVQGKQAIVRRDSSSFAGQSHFLALHAGRYEQSAAFGLLSLFEVREKG